MDAQRFDKLAKTFAGRLSRRNAFRRAGAGAAASLLAATGIRPEQAAALMRAQNDGQPLYTLIRRYTLGVPSDQVRQALQQGYIEAACQAPGFVAYLTVEDEANDFATVAVFNTANDLQNFANAEANWIAQNLDDLLPAPDEAISGDSYIHAAAPQGFPNTCAAAPAPPPPAAPTVAPAPPAPTGAPAQPTAPPAQPTAAPTGPTPTAVPPCTGQGCVCTTGTQAPCENGLICCPTTDLMGGPGVCQPQNVCYPNQCLANGTSCPSTCGVTEACPSCCSNYCNGNGVCDDAPPPCTGEACLCTPGRSGACDSGLVCCQTNSSFGPVCATAANCAAQTCPNHYCGCQGGVQGACTNGLVCCSSSGTPGGPGVCLTQDECTPSCTGQGCGCSGGVEGACDAGFVCCQDGVVIPGGAGTCQPESQCAPITLCTDLGCVCNGGVQGACADGLACCQFDPSVTGGEGTCQPAGECGPPPCIDSGVGCDSTCNWDAGCAGCCSGYCDNTGVCNPAPQSTCISDGVNCGSTCNWSDGCDACCSGFCDGAGNCNEPGASAGACGDQGCGCELANPACVEGLLCCDDGSGVTGTCTAAC